MQLLREHPWYADRNAQRLTSLALLTIAVIAALDAVVVQDVGLGLLYFIPVFVAAAFMSRWWQIVLVSAICAAFVDAFSGFEEGPARVAHVLLAFFSYAFVGFVSRRLAVFSRAAARRLNQLEEEVSSRHQAEERLEMLINSSPAAIVAASPEGNIVFSNKAAHELFGVEPGGLTGQPIATFLPLLDRIGSTALPATVQCSGLRANGDDFPALVLLATFTSTVSPTIAAIVVDARKVPSQAEKVGR